MSIAVPNGIAREHGGGVAQDAAPDSFAHEALGRASRVGRVGHPRLLGQRALRQPVEELQPHRADHGDLREVHVGVHEPWQQDAVAPVEHLRVAAFLPHAGELAGRDDRLAVEGDGTVIERLERVRLRLVQRLEAPPTLAELARTAGFSETRLKGGFRALFGTSIFAYLRQARMEEAHRLFLEHHLNVTEVAQRVGYANPSKFAAAFRRQFGMSPSAL